MDQETLTYDHRDYKEHLNDFIREEKQQRPTSHKKKKEKRQ